MQLRVATDQPWDVKADVLVIPIVGAPAWTDPALSLLMVPWFVREGLAHARGRVHAHVR